MYFSVDAEEILAYYSREDVAKELVRFAQHREVVGRFLDGGYGKRPSTLLHEMDVINWVKQGIVSFHASVELWIQPMALDTGKEMRMGWDLLFDIDSPKLEYSKKAASAIVEAIREHGIDSVYMKFSGRAGFHIFVPSKAFPKRYKDAFPEVPRAIGEYIWHLVKDDLPKEVRRSTKIDSIAIAPRHLVRMPYSLNEKSWLVSIPVDDVDFDIEDAKPENVVVKPFVLEAKENEAEMLVDLALDYVRKTSAKKSYVDIAKTNEEEQVKITGGVKRRKVKIPPEAFPPCIKAILAGGLKDGRKRAEFILRTFLRSAGYSWDEISIIIADWNKKNPKPLREGYLKSQLKWHMKQTREILPPNCDKEGFYKDIGVCKPDDLCKEIKNPIGYAVKKYSLMRKGQKSKKEEEVE